MGIKLIDAENVSNNSIQIGISVGLKPGQRAEFEASEAHYAEITARDGLKIHSVSDVGDVSQVDGPDDQKAVEGHYGAIRDQQEAVRRDNEEVYAYSSARGKATQLGIDLQEVLDAREDTGVHYLSGEYGKVTLQEVILFSASRADRPYEGPIEGGARTGLREGYVPVEGEVANIRPDEFPWPTPVQDGTGKPAQEGHSLEGIQIDSEGNEPIKREGFEIAVGTQDEFKPFTSATPSGRVAKVESRPVMGHEPVDPEVEPEEYVNPYEMVRETADGEVPVATRTSAMGEPQDPDLPDEGDDEEGHKVTPAARERAEEYGIDPESLQGTGRDGNVIVRDVEAEAERRGLKEQ